MTTDKNAAIDKLFNPRAIAIAGASANPNNLGSRNLRLIKAYGYAGKLYAINPKGEASQGVHGFSGLTEIQEPIDLCIIAIPAKVVIGAIGDCVQKEIPVAQILTGGFSETGETGRIAEKKILEKSRGITRLVGPNCLGVFSSGSRITFVSEVSDAVGKVSIASQSGGLSIDMLLQAKSRALNLSKLVSMGNCLDLDAVDFLNYFKQDPETEVIGLYLEGIDRGREFFRSLAETTAEKPVVVLKGGRTSLGAKSVASHTNALAGEDLTWQAAVSQAGAVMAEDVDDFLSLLTASQQFVSMPRGNRIAMIGNGGGATVLATDLMAKRGMNLAVLGEDTKTALSNAGALPGATIGNPSDIPINALNKSGAEVLGLVINGLLQDDAVDNLVIHFNLLALMNYDNRMEIAEGISQTLLSIDCRGKAVYLALRATPEAALEEIRLRVLAAAGEAKLPCFTNLNEAVRTMAAVYHRSKPVRDESGLYMPRILPESAAAAREMILRGSVGKSGLVPQDIAFAVLDQFAIPHPSIRLAKTAAAAAAAAAELGFPVVLKIDSQDISHKTEVGGVRLGLTSEKEVSIAFDEICRSVSSYQPNAVINGILVQSVTADCVQELICGMKRDPAFGPVALLGIGGVLVELLQDVSLKILPLRGTDAHQMWTEIAGSRLLSGYRGRPKADTAAIEDLLLRLSAMAEALPQIRELDLNPVMVLPEGRGVSVVDCRILVDL